VGIIFFLSLRTGGSARVLYFYFMEDS